MKNNIIPLTTKIVETANSKGINHVVLSPGSRSAPLTITFARHPKIQTYVIPDERSAGYFALGMSLSLDQPVGVVCTSGTAAINLYPAVAEAYYQNIPLVILTADRPPEWIDQADGQTIHQNALFGRHVKGYFLYPADQDFSGLNWYADRIVNEAINLATDSPKGPVHINIPIREPFYPDPVKEYKSIKNNRIINSYPAKRSIDNKTWETLRSTWKNSKNVLIIAGQERYRKKSIRYLEQIVKEFDVPVIGDCISNIHGLNDNLIVHHDLILAKKKNKIEKLKPDLLITFGKSVISKNIKLFIRRNNPEHHWHIQLNGYVPDTFQSLTTILPVQSDDFFQWAYTKFRGMRKNSNYMELWNKLEHEVAAKIADFFPKDRFSELESVFHILNHLPRNINLHLANSMPVRYVNLIGNLKKGVEVFSNRGVSGIDGCTSTAMGIAVHSSKLNILLIGDMAFFYDRNGLWHNYIEDNVRIIILNNHGGGIFSLIDGPSDLPELKEFFETDQKLTAKNSANDFDMDYLHCDDMGTLRHNLKRLMVNDGKAKILEIETDSRMNKTIFDTFISQFK